jgi:hypothetical protein
MVLFIPIGTTVLVDDACHCSVRVILHAASHHHFVLDIYYLTTLPESWVGNNVIPRRTFVS